jgi:hypothetical protein
MTPVVAVAGVVVTVAWFAWRCRRAVKVAARPSPHGGLERRRRGSGDGSSLPVPTPGELRTTEEAWPAPDPDSRRASPFWALSQRQAMKWPPAPGVLRTTEEA